MARRFNENFSKRLRIAREHAGLSQREAAWAANITHPTYVRYEKGYSEPRLYTVAELALTMSTTTDFLLGLDIPIEYIVYLDELDTI